MVDSEVQAPEARRAPAKMYRFIKIAATASHRTEISISLADSVLYLQACMAEKDARLTDLHKAFKEFLACIDESIVWKNIKRRTKAL